MQVNNNMISLIAFAGSLFFAGAFINGERVRSNNYREDVRAIEMAHLHLVARMDSIYRATLIQEETILKRIDTAYLVLDQLHGQKEITTNKLKKIKRKIKANRNQIKEDIAAINKISRSGFTWYKD